MSELDIYVCPNCNGPLHFDSKTQKLKCDNCGSTYTTEEIDQIYSEAETPDENIVGKAIELPVFAEDEKKRLQAFDCPACGAQLVTDITTGATACPYCGNNAVIPATFTDSYRPDFVIPFKLEKEDAIKKLDEFYASMPYLPDAFTADNHIDEIKGVYVPFWLYDAKATGHVRARCTRVRTHMEGDYRVTTTDHYLVVRDGNIAFENVPADGSSHMPDDLMDSIEPYDFDDLVPFELGYLPGYMADRYDVEHKDSENRANKRMKNTTKEELLSTIVGYSSVVPEEERVRLSPGSVHYALLPVWLLSTNYKGKNYLFAMNGQTGKMIGDTLPKDWGKIIRNFLMITIIGILIIGAIDFLAQFCR